MKMRAAEVVERYCEDTQQTGRRHYARRMAQWVDEKGGDFRAVVKYLRVGVDGKLPDRQYSGATLFCQYYFLKAAYKHCEMLCYISKSENIFDGKVLPPEVKERFRQAINEQRKPPKVNHKEA